SAAVSVKLDRDALGRAAGVVGDDEIQRVAAGLEAGNGKRGQAAAVLDEPGVLAVKLDAAAHVGRPMAAQDKAAGAAGGHGDGRLVVVIIAGGGVAGSDPLEKPQRPDVLAGALGVGQHIGGAAVE